MELSSILLALEPRLMPLLLGVIDGRLVFIYGSGLADEDGDANKLLV